MASSVGGDLGNIKTGPCHLTVGGADVGHTIDGVKFNVTPNTRERFVDEYGLNAVDIVHQGDDVEVTATLAEFSMAVLGVVYVWGSYSGTQAWGIGRVPGSYSGGADAALTPGVIAKELIIHPLDQGADTSGDVTFFRAVVTDSGEVQFGVITDDRSFEVTWKCLIDDSKTDGELIGTIGVPD